MKKLIFAPLFALFLGCATTEQSTEEENELMDSASLDLSDPLSLTSGSEKPAASPTEKSNRPGTASASATKSEISNELNKALQDAIRGQNADEIIKAAGNVLISYPDDIPALNALAMGHFSKNRFTMAKFFLNKAIKLNPSFSGLHANFGLVLLAQGERREAIQSFKRAVSLNSKDLVASANLGSIYVKEKDYSKALPLLEVVHSSGNKDIKVLNNYGAALSAMGQHKKAEGIFNKVLDQDPSYRQALLNLSILQIVHLKNPKEGSETLNRLKSIDPLPEWRNLIKDLENRVQVSLQ